MSKLVAFEDKKLNDIGEKIVGYKNDYVSHMQSARKNVISAFKARWLSGKEIYENLDYINDVVGSQKAFAEKIGESEAVLSNNKRAYKFLLDEGCETWEEVMNTLKTREISPTIYSFERMGTLLNEPEKETKQKEQVDKDRKRLEELRSEAEEILRRSEPANKPELAQDAFEAIEDLDDIKAHLESFDIRKTKFKSEKYLEFVRNFGYDVITKEPCERCDPHHTDIYGGSGGMGDKLPDYMTIPVTRKTHMMLESGLMEPPKEELMEALLTTMATFISKLK